MTVRRLDDGKPKLWLTEALGNPLVTGFNAQQFAAYR